MTSFLYYAGMAADRQTEQIGLAVAADGSAFERVNGDGLIVRRDAGVSWKSLRVCNPAVIRDGSRWVMFYQGVGVDALQRLTHAIAVAHSTDGVSWHCDEHPVLSFENVRASVAAFADAESGGVIEPAVLYSSGTMTMYFVAYVGSYQAGTWLMRATSADGGAWTIDRDWLMTSTQFGAFRLHYPEIVRDPAGLGLRFSLFSLQTSAAAICEMSSRDGDHFDRLRQRLPASAGLSIGPYETVSLSVHGKRPRGLSRLNRLLYSVLPRRQPYLGYAHSHLDAVNGAPRLYYHAYHLDARGRSWMDIGRCLADDRGPREHVTVLEPSPSPDAWDAFFVADPFVLTS